MRGIGILRSRLALFSVSKGTHVESFCIEPTNIASPATETSLARPFRSTFSDFCSASNLKTPVSAPRIAKHQNEDSSDRDEDDDDDDDGGGGGGGGDGDSDHENDTNMSLEDDGFVQDVKTILSILQELGGNRVEMRDKIEQCGVKVSQELVLEVLSGVRNDWEAAFTFFLWAGRQQGYAHSVREYHSMIAILSKMRKFDTAWSLIDEMRGVKTGISLVTQQTLLIMIRRYCAVHDVGRAINTFYAYKKFELDVGIEEFQSLLSALCRYKNVQDAEHLMFCNKDVFPFNTKSFNIVLNGWCNVIGSPREAERVWREMSKRGIPYDVVSYASMISCYSKAGKLYKVMKLFELMKRMKIEPDRKVYNAVIHALAKGRVVKEAIALMNKMEKQGVAPNVATYNSLIKPLCKARKIEEARGVFDEMLQRGLSPTIRTYHAFFRALRTGEDVFALLEQMRNTGCQPINDTYIMLIRKFCRWRQLDNVFKLWDEMRQHGISPDRSSYIVLIHGLFLNGELEAAYKFYAEMKDKDLLPEPKIDQMLQSWLSNKQIAECQTAETKGNQLDGSLSGSVTKASSKKNIYDKDFIRRDESRRVVRERGFSFWEY